MALCAMAVLAAGGGASAAQAASCALPAAWRVAVEEQGIFERGGPALVVSAPAPSGLLAGDVVRQANGTRVGRCTDLERAAAEAVAKGLVLLLGVEREGRLIAVAATTSEDDTRVAARAPRNGRPEGALPPAAGAAPAASPTPAALAAPRPRRAATLPARGDASAELRRRAAGAAAALARVDDAATSAVPIVAYERRLGDAEAAIAALDFGVGAADSAVRDFVEEAVALHRTAREVRRTQLEIVSEARVDRRGASASALPYFSDSKVPEWVAAYPFLQESILESPRETRVPFPGEVAGRWSAERALELLWARARAASGELTSWSQG